MVKLQVCIHLKDRTEQFRNNLVNFLQTDLHLLQSYKASRFQIDLNIQHGFELVFNV